MTPLLTAIHFTLFFISVQAHFPKKELIENVPDKLLLFTLQCLPFYPDTSPHCWEIWDNGIPG